MPLRDPAPVDTIEPVLTTTVADVSHQISDVPHPADTGDVASDALANVAPVVDTTEPELPTTAADVGHPISDVPHPAETGNVASQAPANAAPDDTSVNQAPDQRTPFSHSPPRLTHRSRFPESATAAPANVTDVSNAVAAVDPTAIAGDVIALNDAPPPSDNALFTGTQYTDYGVTLSSDIAVPQQHAVSPADTASPQDALVVADVQQHAAPPPDIVDTTHPIDHLGLRDAIL